MLYSLSGFTSPRRFLGRKPPGLISAARDMVIQNMDDGVIVLDTKDSIVYVNPAAERIEAIATGHGDRSAKSTPSPIIKEVQKMLKTGKRQSRVNIKMKDGDQARIFDITLSIINDKGGRLGGKVVILKDCTERIQLAEHMEKYSIYDQLTCIYNERYFMEMGQKEMDRLWRGAQSSVALIVTDIDGFGVINHNYGPDAGDRVLKAFADLCSNCIRTYDILGRVGQDRFAIILPNTKLEDAITVAGRITAAVKKTTVPTMNKGSISFTISHGVASSRAVTSFDQGFAQLFDLAKMYLNESKKRGGNQITFF
jgi:diguanylate cyclase (GGDEF)-like protein/PAS domain S-box-containing protein